MYVNYNYVSNLKFTLTLNFLLQRMKNHTMTSLQCPARIAGSELCTLVWYTDRQSIGIGSARVVAGASRVVEVASSWYTCYVHVDI